MKLIASIASSNWAAGFRHVNCTNPACSRWLTQRHLAVRPVGLTLQEDWYCSYRCAAERIDARVTCISVRQIIPAVGEITLAPKFLRTSE